MDTVSVLIFRLESYILRIKEIYSYIFRFFLPTMSEDDFNSGILNKNTNNIRL